MRTLLGSVAAVFIVLGAPAHAAASVPASATFTAVRAPHPLALDPDLGDPAWALGRIAPDGFWNLTTRAAAQLETRVYLLFDDRNLYVGFRAEQAGVPIVAQQTTNDVGFGLDDFVGVGIDTGGAGNQVYFFETTPRATRYQQASENVRYDARWQSVAAADGKGWTAVLVIPLRVMRLQPGTHKTWRFNFIRAVAARGEHLTWAYNGLMVDGAVGQAWPAFSDAQYWPALSLDRITAAGESARPRPRADIYALGSGGSDRDQFAQANGTFGPQRVRSLGVDLTVPLTNTINAVGTIDPDFSNVEIDQQTIAPQEFQRQLQEYRPFFAQGASFLNPSGVGFSSPTGPNNEIFYSPRIGPFDYGAKIEGSFGLQSFGVLTFRGFDQTTGNTFDDVAYGYKHALADHTFSYWADGVLAHHSLAGDDSTTDVGATGHNAQTGFTWGSDQTFEQGSWVPAAGVAHSSLDFVAVNKPNWQSAIGYNDLTPNYNPIDGLTFNSDIHGFQGYLQTSGSTRWTKNYTIQILGDRWFDESGAVHEVDTLASLAATFNNGFSIDNLGPSVGILRRYDLPSGPGCTGPIVGTSSFTGFPCYRNGQDQRFNLFTTALGYKDGTPTPIDASFSFGPFGNNDAQLFSIVTSRPLGRYSLGLEYDGTYERAFGTGVLDSQWLRRISLGESLGAESNLSISVRSINGLGGFAPSAGTNVALAYHRRFPSGNELFVNYGTPAAYSTLQRFIVKFVFHAGGDAGT
jgi:hypothetical protein